MIAKTYLEFRTSPTSGISIHEETALSSRSNQLTAEYGAKTSTRRQLPVAVELDLEPEVRTFAAESQQPRGRNFARAPLFTSALEQSSLHRQKRNESHRPTGFRVVAPGEFRRNRNSFGFGWRSRMRAGDCVSWSDENCKMRECKALPAINVRTKVWPM